MKAIQAADRGGYDALRLVDIPRPRPRAGQVLVRVASAGVTPLDRTVLAGLHPRAAVLPLGPGNEGAGVVIEDPSGRFPAGARVLFFAGPGGVTQDGTFAEMASVPEALRHLIEDRPFGKVTLSVGAIRPAAGSAAGSQVRSAVCQARPRWPMKSSSAWLTSSAWVQMIACGPPAMTVERAFFSNAGSLPAGGLVGQHAILVAVDDQDGNADRGEIAPEVFQAGGDAAEGGVGRRGDGDVEAVLPRLVADPAAAQEIDVVGAVHEVFHRRRPVRGDSRRDAVENARGQCRQDCRPS